LVLLNFHFHFCTNLINLIKNNDQNLKKINVSNKNIDINDFYALCSALENNKVVKKVDFSKNNSINENSAKNICNLIKNNQSIDEYFLF
jgi:hypothetical protein